MAPGGEPALEEGVDYVVERGFVVFTARYLLRRGHCCGSGCRHCPYDAQGRPRPEAVAAIAAAELRRKTKPPAT
ncbi:MAG: hypothetical protein IT460_18285 [Planctomycetes bacterium]|nr:hypothetical protein [Planctomycetota bacterium]